MLATSFHTLSDFFHMGGYGVYVWPAYTLAAVVLVMQVIRAVRARRRLAQRNRLL